MKESCGTGKWCVEGVPHRGWTCLGVEDLGEPSFTCEMCEMVTIRYVHTMAHPAYSDTLDVGCICAGHMEGDQQAAVVRETEFKNRAARRRNWTRRKWRVSRNSNHFLNVNGFNIVVFPHDNHWAGRIENRQTGEVLFSKRRYLHANAAKLAAFDAMEMMMKKLENQE